MGRELPICRACLSTDVALYNIYENDLANVFEQFSGVSVNISDGFPPYLCALCIRLIRRYSSYRLKTQLANEILRKIIPIKKHADKKLKRLQKMDLLNLQTTNLEVISYIPDNRHVDIIEEEGIFSIDEETRSCYEVEILDEELINEEYDVTDFKNENSIETITSSCTDDDKPLNGLLYDELEPIFVINNIKNKSETVNGEETVSEELFCDEKCDATEVESGNDRKTKTTTFTEDEMSQSYNGYSETLDEDLVNEEYDETAINSSCTDDKKTHNGLVYDKFLAINNIRNENVTANGKEIVIDELSFEESVPNETECDKTDVETKNYLKSEMNTKTEQEKSQSDKGHSKISSISAIEGIYNQNVIVIGGGNVGEEHFSEESAQKDVENSETKVVTEINREVTKSTDTVDITTLSVISVTRGIDNRNMLVIDGKKISESKVKTKIIRKRAPKRDKDDEKLPDDFEIDDKCKTAILFYKHRRTHLITRGHMERQLDALEKFSKMYCVDIKYLSKEEQLAVLHKRKQFNKDLPYICDLCFRGYSAFSTYTSHMNNLHDPARGDYACDVCGNRFKSSQLKEKHVNLTHLKRFTCQLCGKVTRSQSFAKAHYTQHKNYTIAEKENKKHGRYRYNSKPIKCPICMVSFFGKVGIIRHKLCAHGQMVTCSDCGAHFENKNLLVKHLGDRCSPDDSPCPMCGVNFSTEAQMMKHFEDTHRGIYKCGHCDLSFTSKFQYSAHQSEIRKEERSARKGDYMCEVCGKNNFRSERNLLNHQLVHLETRRYKCSVCSKAFRVLHLLKMHMRIHKNERRYKCPICSKGFNQPAHREAHLLTHTKERPCKCHICPKTYKSASTLKEHIEIAHQGMPPRKRKKQ